VKRAADANRVRVRVRLNSKIVELSKIVVTYGSADSLLSLPLIR